ncbi:Diacetylchitobiose uptake system permease protein DasC [Anaerolineae bacterium]|nr:Diacetylchitobiose uptake system permease protein DasC [Anaerolineae bacterium]
MSEGRFWKIVRLIGGIILIVSAVFPIYWMLLTSLLPTSELFLKTPRFLPFITDKLSYATVLSKVPIFSWLVNSITVSVGTTVLSLGLAIFGAYGLSRFKFRGKGLLGFMVFVTQMLPEALILVPFYTMFIVLGIINNFAALIIANTAFSMPVLVWILKAAIDAVPLEIEEAARIDGCSYLDTHLAVVLPVIAPSLAAAAITSFFYAWNEYLFAATLVSDEALRTTAVGLSSFIGEMATPLDSVMASAILFTLPAVLFYLVSQRAVVSGMTAGAVKG